MFKYPVIDLVKTGENITRLMEKNKVKVSDLQDIFGFEYPQAIYKWKRGECLPTLDNLIILSTILGYTIYKNSHIMSKNKVVSLAISLLSIYMLRDYITARAQLVTFILFSWELYTIEKLIETKKKRYLINMLIIPFLITQLHCAVFPMFFVLAMPYVGEYLLIKLLNANVLDNLIKKGGEMPCINFHLLI